MPNDNYVDNFNAYKQNILLEDFKLLLLINIFWQK